MAVKIKKSAFPGGIQPEIMLAIILIEPVFKNRGLDLIITSLNDSIHKIGSKHYVGAAADLRVHHIPTMQLHPIMDEINAALPEGYDVILEAAGTSNAHIHLEFDPKPHEIPPSAGQA